MARHHLACAPRRRRTRARRPDARPRRRACIPLTDLRMCVPGGSAAQEAASGVLRRIRGRCSLVWQRARGELARMVIKNDKVRLGLWILRFQDGHSPKEIVDRLTDAKVSCKTEIYETLREFDDTVSWQYTKLGRKCSERVCAGALTAGERLKCLKVLIDEDPANHHWTCARRRTRAHCPDACLCRGGWRAARRRDPARPPIDRTSPTEPRPASGGSPAAADGAFAGARGCTEALHRGWGFGGD